MSKQLTVKKFEYSKDDTLITMWQGDHGINTQLHNNNGQLLPKGSKSKLDYIYVSIIYLIKYLNYKGIELDECKKFISEILVKKANDLGEKAYEEYDDNETKVRDYALKYLYEQDLYSDAVTKELPKTNILDVFVLSGVQPQAGNVLMTLEPKYAWVTDDDIAAAAAAGEAPLSTLSKTKELLVKQEKLPSVEEAPPAAAEGKAAEDQPEYVAIYSGVGKLKEAIGEILKITNDNHTFIQPLPISASLDINTALRFMDPYNPVLIVFYVPVNDTNIPLLSFIEKDINLTDVIMDSNQKNTKKRPNPDSARKFFPDKVSEQEIFLHPFIEWIKIKEDESVSLKCKKTYPTNAGGTEWRDVIFPKITVIHLLYKRYDENDAFTLHDDMVMEDEYYENLYDSIFPEQLPANQGGGKKKRKPTTKNRKHKKKHKYTKYRTSKNKKKMSRRKRSNRKSKRKISNV
jgi:hypothetical protein